MRVNNELTCHEFAKGASADLSIYSNNIHLKKSCDDAEIYLYSYNTIIAIYNIKKDVFLVSTRYYSMTTRKHQGYIRRALHGYNVIYMYDCNISNYKILKNFMYDLKDYAIKQLRARKWDYTHEINNVIENCNKFINFSNYDKRKKEYKDFMEIKNCKDEKRVNLILDLNKKEILKAEKLRQKKLKVLKAEKLKEINELKKINFHAFLDARQKSFESDKDFYKMQKLYHDYFNKIYKYNLKDYDFMGWHKDLLKVTDKDNVITSQRVVISKVDFIRLYKAFKSGLLSIGADIIGYRLREIKKDYVVIGCHTIALKDIEHIYNKLTKRVNHDI